MRDGGKNTSSQECNEWGKSHEEHSKDRDLSFVGEKLRISDGSSLVSGICTNSEPSATADDYSKNDEIKQHPSCTKTG